MAKPVNVMNLTRSSLSLFIVNKDKSYSSVYIPPVGIQPLFTHSYDTTEQMLQLQYMGLISLKETKKPLK